ncbi:GNAT family N-acetyltransferase [Nocardiopsis sp. CNT312]|uniref:GNAT family N-acetyltransferase n=1 Tax=Nocardiopsis sp. CNT312 TaxID=1137268 RepID=UPI00048DF5E1|nr:GNAT family N-acetyltransferase [Nocardiopsis sp. CNT312]
MSPTVTAAARRATIEDIPGVARVLSRALADDPLFRWLFPDDAQRMARTRRFFALAAGFGYVPAGDTRVVSIAEGAFEDPVIRAAALWAPASSNPEGPLVSPRTWPHWVPLIGRERLGAFVRLCAEWKMAAPQEPHLYLAVLGVDPALEGAGLAKELLESGLARSDDEGLPAFTQTLSPESVDFYERFGFRVVQQVEQPGIGTSRFLMRTPA